MVLISFLLIFFSEPSPADEGGGLTVEKENDLFLHILSYVFAVVIAAWRFYARLRWIIARTWVSRIMLWGQGENGRHLADGKTVIFEFDLEGRLTYASPSTECMTGQKPAEILGHFFNSFLPDPEVPRAIQAFITVMMGRRIRDMGLEMLTSDGFSAPVSAHFLPLFKDREVVGVRGFFRDLRRSEELEKGYEVLAKSSQTGVYIIQSGKLTLVNPQFQRCTGYTEKDLINTDPISLVHPEDREMVSRRAVMMLKGERTEPYEFRLLTRDGRIERVREIVTSVWYRGQRAVLGNYIIADPQCQERGEHSGLSPV
ncbi:MAG: PAS domain S-box protein [Deltaproteobacteria bacterium]|nr:PAS domain S-box protein [Deltaproteobacteria bacterium]